VIFWKKTPCVRYRKYFPLTLPLSLKGRGTLLFSSPLRGEGAGAKNNEHRIAQRASR